MRALVQEHARRIGVVCQERTVELDDLRQASEILLTNAVLGVLPVTRIPDLGWQGERGPITVRLMEAAAGQGVTAWSP
jgi:4-amino-4-deoxychorismate lyase